MEEGVCACGCGCVWVCVGGENNLLASGDRLRNFINSDFGVKYVIGVI